MEQYRVVFGRVVRSSGNKASDQARAALVRIHQSPIDRESLPVPTQERAEDASE